MSRIIALCSILICHLQLATAQDADVSDEQIDRLISELVSPNEAPKRSGPLAVYPEGYDKDAQRKVSKAYQALRKVGPKAFQRLFKHFDDKRFCMNGDGGETQVNKTVGQVCIHLIDSQIEPYSARGGPGSRFSQRSSRPPNYFSHFKLEDPKNAHEWWETRKDKSLKELQIEVLEWVMKEEEKLVEKYTDKDRDSMRKKLEDLRMQENPIPPASLFAR